MAIEILQISPPAAGSAINGDLHIVQEKISAGTLAELQNLLVGRDDSKLPFHWACFFRFETLIPKGSLINGIKLGLWANGVSFQTMTKMQGGWIRPQTVGTKHWQKPDGVGEWDLDTDVPLAEWDDGASADVTVWWNDAPAFSSQAMTTQPTALEDWSIGDGRAAFNSVPNLAAQLQSYLDDDDNELLRGTGNTADALPICFQIFEEFIGGNGGGSQGLIASDHLTDTAFHPFLEIDWSPAIISTEGAICGRTNLSPTILGKTNVGSSIKGKTNNQSTILGNPAIHQTVNGKVKVTATIHGRARIGKC